MANEFLVSKWKLWYHSLDVNHDGKISIEDVNESRTKFEINAKLMGPQARQVAANFADWWEKYIFRGMKGDISEDMFISSLNQAYTEDQKKFLQEMTDCFKMFFDVIDTNHDRSISEEEFLHAFMAFGHEDIACDKNFFCAYKPENNLVPLKDIVDSWIKFVTTADASEPGIVKKALEDENRKK